MADYDWWWEGKSHHSQMEDRVLALLSFSFVEEELGIFLEGGEGTIHQVTLLLLFCVLFQAMLERTLK